MSPEIDLQIDDHIAVLTINRPEARNALSWSAQGAFAAAVNALGSENGLRALIITGSGRRAFVAGGDLRELATSPEKAAGRRLNATMSQALTALTRLPLPVIAAINGDAVGGGCEIITACDLRLAREGARLIFGQIRVGLTTGWGGAGRLVRLIGQSRAAELLLTGRPLSAAEAHNIGLVHRLVADDADVTAAARAWAAELVDLPAETMAAMKALVHHAAAAPPEAVAAFEQQQFLALYGSPNHQEALRAFTEKRRPRFNQD